MDPLLEGLRRWEGLVNWLYLDTKGLVTTGLGFFLQTADACAELPWIVSATGEPANEVDCRIAYETVSGAEVGHAAQFYRPMTLVRLREDAIWKLAEKRLDVEFLPALRAQFKGFDDYPLPAQKALVDMAWNLGTHGLKMFFNLHTACEAHEWIRAMRSCHIRTEREERNDFHRQLFGEAARGAAIS